MARGFFASEVALGQAHIEIGNPVSRNLALKGISEQVSVHVIRGVSA